jgi:hypothetical protein
MSLFGSSSRNDRTLRTLKRPRRSMHQVLTVLTWTMMLSRHAVIQHCTAFGIQNPTQQSVAYALEPNINGPLRVSLGYNGLTSHETSTGIWWQQSSQYQYSSPSAPLEFWPRQNSTCWQEAMSPTISQAADFRYHVFCDLDGVLVDFEAGIRGLFPEQSIPTGFNVDDLHRPTMWQRAAESGRFFEHLPWTCDGRALWELIRPLNPDILTGVPSYSTSRLEKFRWCQRELDVELEHIDKAGILRRHVPGPAGQEQGLWAPKSTTRVITCWAQNKHHESGPGRVLIDDRTCLKENWEKAGGIFIHHQTGNLMSTIRQLQQHRILTMPFL